MHQCCACLPRLLVTKAMPTPSVIPPFLILSSPERRRTGRLERAGQGQVPLGSSAPPTPVGMWGGAVHGRQPGEGAFSVHAPLHGWWAGTCSTPEL